MTSWLNYVPGHKITCDHDSTSVEMGVGSSLFTREIIAQVMAERAGHLAMKHQDLRRVALGFLHNNSVAIYGVGQHVPVERLDDWTVWYYSNRRG